MEQTTACVLNVNAAEKSIISSRSGRGNECSLPSCFSSGAQLAASRLVKMPSFRKPPSLEAVSGFLVKMSSCRKSLSLGAASGFQTGGNSHYMSSSGSLSSRLGVRNIYSEYASVPHVYKGGRVQNLPVGRLDSRVVGVDNNSNHGRGVAGVGNAMALVDKARRNSNALVLTAEDLPRHSSNFSQRSELGIASQKSLVLPEKANDASKQLCVAVDVDEVLGSFLAALNRFIEETYSVRHEVSEYYIYDFMKVWNCSQIEANHRVHAFFDSDHFKHGISPIPGAHQTLLQLASYCQLVVVTSRQHIIRDRTLEWIERHYAGVFKEVHFGNHFALEGPSRRKSEICRALGANVLIDDNPRYAIDCAESGIEVLLFDLHGGYPWSKTPCGPDHPLITRVKDWQEVQEALLARTCAEL